jgi:hypothetical protein
LVIFGAAANPASVRLRRPMALFLTTVGANFVPRRQLTYLSVGSKNSLKKLASELENLQHSRLFGAI